MDVDEKVGEEACADFWGAADLNEPLRWSIVEECIEGDGAAGQAGHFIKQSVNCLFYKSPSPRDS